MQAAIHWENHSYNDLAQYLGVSSYDVQVQIRSFTLYHMFLIVKII
jgi:hypothetical protein